MACGCCHSCCGCGCGSSWNSGCGCDWDSGITTLPSFPDTAVSPSYRFPVYVSYPSFYAGAADIAAATAEHKVIKLLAVVENGEAGVSARVYPALIDENHPLASVHGSFNAVFVKAEAADDLMFYGRGAGGAPTASAVVGDVVTEARHIAAGCTGPSIPLYKNLPKAPITASKAAFAVRFLIHDKPGVLAAIAAEFAKNGVSINGVNQDLKPTMTDPGYDGEIQQLRIVTHLTDEETLRNTVKAVQALDFVTGDPSVLRVLD